MTTDERMMQRCLQLAILGLGQVSPNPMVGSVLVYEGEIIGEGYHQQYGEGHAEVNCLQSVANKHQQLISASTLYVSLEPCAHFGKTPPCTDLILKHKIKKVVIGCQDISSKVNGKGIEKLRLAGVEVIEDVLKEACMAMNRRFFCNHLKHRPYIILKWAESADGYIGQSHQTIKISNAFTDRMVHQWRADEDAILVGYRTALQDNPRLNVRLAEGKQPVRIVIDEQLTLPPTLHLFDESQTTFVFNLNKNSQDTDTEYIKISKEQLLPSLLEKLVEKKIQSVIIEGGRALLQQFIKDDLWDEARVIQNNRYLYEGIQRPNLINATLVDSKQVLNDVIYFHKNNNRIT